MGVWRDGGLGVSGNDQGARPAHLNVGDARSLYATFSFIYHTN